jgi:hypothetical protein
MEKERVFEIENKNHQRLKEIQSSESSFQLNNGKFL